MSNPTYTVFKRSCRNWEEFSQAEKEVIETGLEYSQAREQCLGFNSTRGQQEKEAGTMYEFTEDGNL